MSKHSLLPLISSTQIRHTIIRMAGEIKPVCENFSQVQVIVLLEGARRFAQDLLNEIGDPKYIVSHLKASSYYGNTCSSGQVTIQPDSSMNLNFNCQTVLLIDDIYDTGNTLSTVIQWLREQGAQQVMSAVLLVKKRSHERPITIDFAGMEIDDLFVVGYGLDFNGHYRDLDYIALLQQ